MINRISFNNLGFNFLEIESANGELDLLDQLPESGLAIVGTRYPQRRSFELLEKTIKELKDSKLVIVSGFARGIDSRAHELAIEYGLKTIAILGCGLNVDYPSENRMLRKKVLDSGGLMISPYEVNTPAYPGNFLERNQLIAYFSKAVWVVEAAARSGTLNTANHASSMNRDLYATSCYPGDRYFEGNQKLLSQQDTDRYPIAEPFFNAITFCKSWNHLQPPKEKKKPFNRRKISRIQKWVLEIKESGGECFIQSLFSLAMNEGMAAGEFYREYQKEITEGRLKEDRLGLVDLL